MFAQTDRPLILTTPLGKDALLLSGFQGREAISELFRFELQTAWQVHTNLLPFDQLLGKKVTIEMTYSANKRYINGIVSRITQGFRDEKFTHYVLEVVPELWLLGRKQNCRTFQQITVPDILKKVLTGLDVSYQIQQTFQPREYCVQYNETDLAFISRLMEDEGIFYFFKHSASGHQLVLADSPLAHPAVPYLPTALWDEGTHGGFEENRVFNWTKQQEIRSGKFTTWGHNFQLPQKHLDAAKPIVDSVGAGGVNHKLKVAGNDRLEIYEYPGGYASRFDAVTKTGGDQSANLQHLFDENQRIANIRMQEEAVASMLIRSAGRHGAFTAGHTFELTGHFSDNGKFALTSVEHLARQSLTVDDTRNSTAAPFEYSNSFTCIPIALPFRPPRITPVPSIRGVQTAVVVGPAGEEIFTDKYGRVKIQFHWDREGQSDANSSCWVRVAIEGAGTQFGGVHLPRIGQEVVVDFVDGDVDQPIIVGNVYNADTMPPWTLPDGKNICGTKTRSTPGGSSDNYNEMSFDDTTGSELANLQAEKDFTALIKHDENRKVGNTQTIEVVKGPQMTIVGGSKFGAADSAALTGTDGDQLVFVANDRKVRILNDDFKYVDNDDGYYIARGSQVTEICNGSQANHIHLGNHVTETPMGSIHFTAMQEILLTVGQNSIKIDQSGVTINGMMISVQGSAMVQVQGGLVTIN
jgi:type VI secretion system secreted protein VgrG